MVRHRIGTDIGLGQIQDLGDSRLDMPLEYLRASLPVRVYSIVR